MLKKIILGGAQFGSNYGITNFEGVISPDKLKTILNFANKNGINMIDTAIKYGDSEKNLGKSDLSNWNIISKFTNKLNSNLSDYDWLKTEINLSLKRLRKCLLNFK